MDSWKVPIDEIAQLHAPSRSTVVADHDVGWAVGRHSRSAAVAAHEQHAHPRLLRRCNDARRRAGAKTHLHAVRRGGGALRLLRSSGFVVTRCATGACGLALVQRPLNLTAMEDEGR